MAGPDLNPQTFDAGMANYPAKTGPFGLWDFGPGDRTAANDVREIYWDHSAISTYNGKQGAYIENEPGKRFKPGSLPSSDPKVFGK